MAIVTGHTIGSDQVVPACATKDVVVVATPWTDQPDLYCDSLVLRVNNWDQAVLSFDFGQSIRQPNRQAGQVATVSPLALVGKFVRVSFSGFNWYGYIESTRSDRLANAAGDLLGNRQFFNAVGLAYFLDRNPIRSASIHNDGPSQPDEIGRALAFNAGDGANVLGMDRKSRGNMHPSDDVNSLRSFYDPGDTINPAQVWSATDIIDHVLFYHGPRDVNGIQRPAPYIREGFEDVYLNDWKPSLRVENRTAFEVLSSLANPQRGLCWWAYYEDDELISPTGAVRVTVTSLATAAIALNQGGVLPANGDQETLNTDGDAGATVRVGRPRDRRYDRVVCRGAKQTGTGTIGAPDSTLGGNWDALGTAPSYLAGAVLTDGYAGLSDDDQKSRNDAFRRQEEFARVFSSFAIPNDWDGLVGNGLGTVQDAAMFPMLTGAGTPSGQHPHYWPGLRILPHLMIAPSGGAPSEADPEFMPPFALVKVSESPDRHQFVEKLGNADYASGTAVTEDLTASYALRAEADICGLRLRSTKAPHTLAKNHWAGAEPTATEPELDWQTLRATVSIEGDSYCEGFYPTPPSNLPIQELVIDMGDNYRLDYLVAGTVTGLHMGWDVGATPYYEGTVGVASGVVTLSGGTFPAEVDAGWTIVIAGVSYTVDSRQSGTQVTLTDNAVNLSSGEAYVVSDTTGRVLRDDRNELADFARFAYEWYQEARRELEVTFTRIDAANFGLGKMITTLGAGSGQETINTVIGVIAWDFGSGTTRVQTIPDSLQLPELLS